MKGDQSSTDGDEGEADESEGEVNNVASGEEEACDDLSTEESFFSGARIRSSGKGRLWTRNLSRKNRQTSKVNRKVACWRNEGLRLI